jgi:hypothetical protein
MRPSRGFDGSSAPRAWARRVLFLLTLAAAIVAKSWALFLPSSNLGVAGPRPYVIESFREGEPVGQSFRILDDGLESVDIALSSTEPAVVDLRWRLFGTSAKALRNWAVIYSAERRLRVPRGRSWHHFTFIPIFPSEKKIYQFQVEPQGIRPVDARSARAPVVGVVASAEDSLTDGNVLLGTAQDIHHDLFIKARTATPFTRFRMFANMLLPRPLRNLGVQLALLAMGTWLLAVFAFEMTVRGPEQADRDAR